MKPHRFKRQRLALLLFVAGGAWSTGGAPANPPTQGTAQTAWRRFTTSDGLPSNSIRSIRVADGDVWVGTDNGLALFSHGLWKHWTSEDGLAARIVSAIDVDPTTRDVWLGTWGDGLIRFSAGRFDRFDQMNSGLAGNLIFAVAAAPPRIWAATNGGLSAFDPMTESWQLYDARRADGSTPAIAALSWNGAAPQSGLAAPLSSDLYAGVWRGGVLRFDTAGDRWIAVSKPSQTPAPPQSKASRPGGGGDLRTGGSEAQILFTESGGWIVPAAVDDTGTTLRALPGCVDELMVRFPSGQPGRACVPPDFFGTRVRCVAAAGNKIWIGTSDGLFYGPMAALDEKVPAETRFTGAGSGAVLSKHPTYDDTTGVRAPAMAVLGPQNKTIALPGSRPGERTYRNADVLAVRLAIAEANERRTQERNGSIALVTDTPGYAGYGWVLPEDEFVTFLHRSEVMGIIGSIPPGDRIADLVTFRTEIPLVNAAPMPTGGIETGFKNPWLFRCWGDQPRRLRTALDYVFDELGLSRVAVLQTPGEASRRHLAWWRHHAARRGREPVVDIRCDTTEADFGRAAVLLRSAQADVVLSWCDPTTAGKLLRRLRKEGVKSLFLGGPGLVTPEFVRLAGDAPGSVLALVGPSPPTIQESSPQAAQRLPAATPSGFADRYVRRLHRGYTRTAKPLPDARAYDSFNAADHLLEALAFIRSGIPSRRPHSGSPSQNGSPDADRDTVHKRLDTMLRSSLGELHYERRYPPPGVTAGRSAVVASLVDGRWITQTLPMK